MSNKRTKTITLLTLLVTIASVGILAKNNGNQPLWQLALAISSEADPVPDFTFATTGDCPENEIEFTNTSTGTDLTFLWEFRDGTQSTEENPTHIFETAVGNASRTFNVKLTVTDGDGIEKSITKNIEVQEVPSLKIRSTEDVVTFDGLLYFSVCDTQGYEFTFFNDEGPSENNILYEINWGDGSDSFSQTEWTEELKHTYEVGNYTITYSVTPENGCKVSRNYGVFIGSNPAVGLGTPGNTNVCVGEELTFPITNTDNNPDGTIYTVNFSDGSTPEIFTHPPPESVSHIFTEGSCGASPGGFGNYFSVTITAANPCSFSQASVLPIYVSEPAVPVIEVESEIVCVDETISIENITDFSGEISINGSCNTPEKFVWEISPATGWTLASGSLGNLQDPLEPNSWTSGTGIINPTFTETGTYEVKLIIGNRCGEPAEEIIEIRVLAPPTVNAGEDLEICNGEELTLAATATGGSENFEYSWTSTPFSSIQDKNTLTPTVKPTQTTVFTLTVEDTDSGCISVDEIEITVIPAPVLEFDIPDQEICSGETSQLVNITSTPAGESITWTSEANGLAGVSTDGTNQIPAQELFNTTGSPVDIEFTALISNSNQGSCTVVPAVYVIRVLPEPIYSDARLSTCSDQAFSFTPADNISGSTFTWTVDPKPEISGATNSSVEENSIEQLLINTTNQPIDISYTITPILNSCIGDPFELVVTVQPSPSLTFSEEDQTLCTGSDSKAVEFSSDVVGATFNWTAEPNGVTGVIEAGTGNQLPTQSLINPSNQPITIEYNVFVSTSSGGTCSGVPKVYRITVNPSLVIEEQISDFNGFGISCNGSNDGSIELNPTGGSGVYFYAWSGPNGFTSSDQNISNLSPGTYQVQLTDEYGCSIGKTYQFEEPQPINSAIVSTTDILCAGDESGIIEISVTGGVEPYQFEWQRDGVSIPANSQNLSGVLAGTYDLLISDANGCIEAITGIELTEPENALVINYAKTDISCYGANDGSLDLDVSGGAPPYTINWTFGSSQSGFDNLGPGDYTLTVSDQSGCTRTQTITIEDATRFLIDSEVSNISCFGENDGSIELNLSGGEGQTTIRWDHGSELESIYNLSAGFYGVTITDETDCDIRSEFNIIEPALLSLEPKVTDAVDCDNPQSGEIDLGISGGTVPYSVEWSNGSTSEILTGITSGQYAVTIIDASGCTINQVFEIKRPPALSIVGFQTTNIQCEPRAIEEEFQITISGGIAPYTIDWSAGEISTDGKTMKTSTPGLYEVTVTDGKGCQTSETFEVENLEIIPEMAIESATFQQYNSYLVNFEMQFINKSFGQITSYHWDFGDGTESFEENPVHIYEGEGDYEITLTITDIFGCSAEVKKEISVFDYYLVMPNVFTPNDDGVNDYFFPKFINIESLEFWILNKWGETIYFTDDKEDQGWDGRINGDPATPGNYVYKIKFKTLDGRTQTETDLLLLMK